jgi:alanine racemase
MARPARALLNAAALRHNFSQVRQRAPRARVMAVVKANGYGHGSVWVARTLAEADAFGVACIEEALTLREAGIAKPIVLLEGFFEAAELALIVQHHLATAIHDEEQLRMLEAARLARPIPVWIKLDTGMHRLGFLPEQFAAVHARLKASANVGEIRVMSHFANADDPAQASTRTQIERFNSQVASAGLERSFANSAGIVAWPDAHYDWVRPGIMLYGGAPLVKTPAQTLDLKPVMTLETALIAVHRFKKGESIGYGSEFHCPEDMNVGVAAIGYGDGYPRRMPPTAPVLLNGRRVTLAGRVAMDMITLDLRSQPDAKVGDRVVLWGEGLPADGVAGHAGTISYELFCQLTPRVPRVVLV